MPAPKDNQNHKGKVWSDALRRALLANDGKKLRLLAGKLIAKAMKGDVHALKEIGDRIEGKVPQGIVGADGGPVEAKVTIEFV